MSKKRKYVFRVTERVASDGTKFPDFESCTYKTKKKAEAAAIEFDVFPGKLCGGTAILYIDRKTSSNIVPEGMNNIGKRISPSHRQAGNDMLKKIGIESSDDRALCIREVSDLLERDRPDAAMARAEDFVDLTAVYMLFAALLAPIKKTSF